MMSKEIEEWRPIQGYEGLYEVSDWGRVKRLEKSYVERNNRKAVHILEEKILKLAKFKKGYLYITLTKNGERKTKAIHRLVAETFLPNPNNYNVIHHINHNPQNNILENLEWMKKEDHDKIHSEKKSESYKGKHNSPSTEFKKGMTPWIKGKHHSKESIEKMKESHKGHTPWNKGKKGYMSDTARKKIGETNRNQNSIPIIQIKDNKIIEWKSAAECANANKEYKQSAIRAASKGQYSFKKGHQYKDSIWYEKKEYEKKMLGNQS